MNIQGIDHVVLRVRDLDGAVSFYQRVLGCPVERRQDAIGMVQMRAGRALIDLVSVDGSLGQRGGAAPGRDGHNMDHLCLALANFDPDAVKSELERHGIVVGEIGSRFGASGEGVSLYFTDPEGNRIELRGA
ncbi:MAG: VOC family virulence protein [Rhizobium sp.]|nr:MAG: VOC family virulence protein [Rhizobium sp.]